MLEPMLWIGGWASNLACWRGAIEERYPGRRHRFLDAHAILADAGVLESAAAGMPKNGVILAWSLGSLLLHRALAEGPFPDVRTVSISPVFDFCGEGSPWPPTVLAHMLRKLARSREEVLADFWTLIRGDSRVSKEAEESWKRQASGYGLDALSAGLDALGSVIVRPAALPVRPGRHAFVASPADPLAPAAPGMEEAPGWTRYPHGHLPFLDYPDLVLAAMGGTRTKTFAP